MAPKPLTYKARMEERRLRKKIRLMPEGEVIFVPAGEMSPESARALIQRLHRELEARWNTSIWEKEGQPGILIARHI